MDDHKALGIVSALANGVNPLNGEVFAADSPYQSADVVRALYVALRALERGARQRTRVRSETTANAGKPWTEDEDRRLLASFDEGALLADIARAHGRTAAGVQARLEKHGRLQAPNGGRPHYRRATDQGAGRTAPSPPDA